ncbi:hypothetical protein Nepgr_027277 [Nepenthes gracilis]|uniref:Uncharacterized protein n=1 Tax=Nepenthes gracilis TaxID=150966 RepID=A0AAD3TA16_NEPGR|nr:hypothetical protein Nepgr_027277 [Nepenthes gracilis]
MQTAVGHISNIATVNPKMVKASEETGKPTHWLITGDDKPLQQTTQPPINSTIGRKNRRATARKTSSEPTVVHGLNLVMHIQHHHFTTAVFANLLWCCVLQFEVESDWCIAADAGMTFSWANALLCGSSDVQEGLNYCCNCFLFTWDVGSCYAAAAGELIYLTAAGVDLAGYHACIGFAGMETLLTWIELSRLCTLSAWFCRNGIWPPVCGRGFDASAAGLDLVH